MNGERHRRAQRTTLLWVFTGVVCAVGATLVTTLIASGPPPTLPPTSLALILLAGLAGAFPVRFASSKTAFAPTHPFILCALATGGAPAAAVTAVTGVLGATLRTSCRITPVRSAFNTGAALLASGAAAWVFALTGGVPGQPWNESLAPLTIAATAYFVVNTALVALAVAVDRGVDPWRTWLDGLLWTVASGFTGLTLAVLLLALVDRTGVWGLTLALPPVVMFRQFYAVQRRRIEESECRIREVEELNRCLEATVGDLRDALAHVKSLQGLLPICMHCKSIRDDNDAWHRLEAYISEHADVTFTHSLCAACREEHYPPDRSKPLVSEDVE